MNLDINKDVIEEIRGRCDIADLISSCGVQLKRSGSSSFKGLCPFHQEKTPSFHVDTAKQSFHCFGCGKGGDVFRFFMDKENVDFPNAVQILAARCGVLIPEKVDGRPADPRKRDERERLFAINAEFSNFFCRYLKDNPRSPAAIYLASRNIPREIAEKFRIGAVPDSWTACRDYGRSLGFSDNDMVTAGILRRKEETGNIYDQFKGRLAFTIENEQGKPVGFSARSLEAKPQDGRKYVNTPETPVFHKGSLLYALPHARQGIGRHKMAVLCEGQLDAIAFHRAGFDCAVAPLGTAFTPEQAKIIHRYSRNLILAFDADGAGKKAVLRAAEILLPLSVDLRVLQIPGGKDPDELFSHGGKDAVADALAHTVGWMEILKNTLPERFDLASPVGRSQAAAFVASFIRLVNNEVELEVYTKEAAKMLEISENAMKAEFSGASVLRSYTAKNDQPAQVPPRRRNSAAMLTLLELAIADSNCGRAIAEQVSPELIPGNTPVEMALNLAINAALNDEMTALEGQLKDLLITQPSPEVSKALYQPTAIVPEKRQRALAETIKELLDSRKRKSQSDLLTKLREAVTDEEKMQILAELQNSTQQQERNPGI